jgi:mRNA-degrading endonuclease RelE of RelBE toxin-antitoxin system
MVNTTNQYKLTISRYFTKKFSRLMEKHCEFGLAFGFTLEELYANRVESDHAALKEQIEAMESSKFWKIRQNSFKILRSIGLPVGDSMREYSSQQSSQQLQERLRKMQNSNFWKARGAWFRVKRTIGLPVDDE